MSFLSLVGRRGRHCAVNIEEMEEEVSLTNLYLLKPTNWFYIFFFLFFVTPSVRWFSGIFGGVLWNSEVLLYVTDIHLYKLIPRIHAYTC